MEENEVVVNYEEILANMYGEMQGQTKLLNEIKQVQGDSYGQLQVLNGSLLVVVTFMCLKFSWSCIRQWRKNVLKMGE